MSFTDPLVLRGVEVVVRVDAGAEPEALWAAAALVAMASRVAGHVVTPTLPLPRPNPWAARSLPAASSVGRFVRSGRHMVTRRVQVGLAAHAPEADLYIGGDDWTATVSRRAPVAIGPCRVGGLGVQVAAALALGELLKDVVTGEPQVRIETELTWNLVTGVVSPTQRINDKPLATGPEPVNVALFGAGSVGSSAVALLALTGLTGRVDIVDPDVFEPRRNAVRCPGVPAIEAGAKADWAAGVLTQAGWDATAHRGTIADWRAVRGPVGFPGIALVAVDNVDGRREAGEVLAATTVSAGVNGTRLHVQRHLPADDLACPYCDLVDVARWRSQAGTYARLGLTAPRLQALLDGEILTTDDVAKAIWAGSVDPGALPGLSGGRLVDLLARSDVGRPEIAAPHVSWLTGALLAVEVAKAATGLPGLDRRVDVDVAGVPLGGWRRPARNPSGRCPCTNPGRRALARTLYGP